MYCKQCGAQISDSAKFCGKCGSAVAGKISQTQNQMQTKKSGRNGSTHPDAEAFAMVHKDRVRKIILTLAVILVALIIVIIWFGRGGSFANTTRGTEGLYYSYDNASYTVTGYSGTSKNVVIPDTYEGFPVTEVEYSSFENSDVKSVVFGKNIEIIGRYAFEDAENLTSVTFTSSDVYLSADCFHNCKSLRKVKFVGNASIFCLDYQAFYNCSSLKKLNLPEGLYMIDQEALSGCTGIRSFTIPSTCSSVANDAFRNWTSKQTIYVTSYIPTFSWCDANIKYKNSFKSKSEDNDDDEYDQQNLLEDVWN